MADIEKKVVQLELEVHTKTVDSSKKSHQKWIFLAQAVDVLEDIPRAFLSVYIFIAILSNNLSMDPRRTSH